MAKKGLKSISNPSIGSKLPDFIKTKKTGLQD